MALPTQDELKAIDAYNGGTASAPLTAEQQEIYKIGQSQSTSQQTPSGPIPYTPPASATVTPNDENSASTPIYAESQLNQLNLVETNTAPVSPKTLGAGAANDDASPNNTVSGTNFTINASTNPGNPIRPSPNALDQFASYTYSLSLYLLTPEQYKAMGNSKINSNQWSLLMQSGGAAQPLTTAAPPPPKAEPPATQTRPVTASYNPDGTVNATDANAFGAG